MNRNYRNVRETAAKILFAVFEQKKSLNPTLAANFKSISEKDYALLQEITTGCVRQFLVLNPVIKRFLTKEFKGKLQILHYLLLVGAYQLFFMRIPEHAIINETVNAVSALKHANFKNVINAILRNMLRQKNELEAEIKKQTDLTYLHPTWLRNRIKQAYPNNWQQILIENNQKPPIWLRINQQFLNVKEYQDLANEHNIRTFFDPEFPFALRLDSQIPITHLPGFNEGWFFVQNPASQLIAPLFELNDSHQILDLCAAPGGKTTHILELLPNAQLLIIELSEIRAKRIVENINRLRLKTNAKLEIADALYPESWAKNKMFDRILIDAPCSSTGVIRHHPDIKWLKNEHDISNFVKTQTEMLDKIWAYLKPNGILIYSTCSILPEENNQQIERFLSKFSDSAKLIESKQLLPKANGTDGFFYAKIKKC